MTALDDIAAERRRQIEVEGWTEAHDDTHSKGEMANAAAAYAMTVDRPWRVTCEPWTSIQKRLWPWSEEWWKPQDRRRDLVRAGALIVAEIDRLDRLNQQFGRE